MVKAIEHLRTLQKDLYSRLGYVPNTSLEKYGLLNDKLMDKILSSYAELLPEDVIDYTREFQKKDFNNMLTMELPTEYEDRLEYSMIVKLARDIERSAREIRLIDDNTKQIVTLKDMGMKITATYFGTLPTGDTNALTFPCDDGYLIVFESELVYFCYLLSKIIAWSFPIKKENDKIYFIFEENAILSRLESNREILQRFGELIVAYAMGGKNRLAPQYLIDAPYSDLASELTQAMELFVMGHEYSHVLLQHKPMKNGRIGLTDIRDYYKKMFSWTQEYEADYWGIQLMLKAMEVRGCINVGINYGSIEAFFCGFEVMKRAVSILKRGTDDWFWQEGRKDGPVGTHPPFQNRRRSTRTLMMKKYGVDSVKMCMLIELIINNLWANVRPFIESMHKQGLSPHPRWTVYDRLES